MIYVIGGIDGVNSSAAAVIRLSRVHGSLKAKPLMEESRHALANDRTLFVRGVLVVYSEK